MLGQDSSLRTHLQQRSKANLCRLRRLVRCGRARSREAGLRLVGLVRRCAERARRDDLGDKANFTFKKPRLAVLSLRGNSRVTTITPQGPSPSCESANRSATRRPVFRVRRLHPVLLSCPDWLPRGASSSLTNLSATCSKRPAFHATQRPWSLVAYPVSYL